MHSSLSLPRISAIALGATALAACSGGPSSQLPPATYSTVSAPAPTENYILGPLDKLTINVWRNPELSAEDIQVRPDGRITIPLVRDLVVVGKTPAQLEDQITSVLNKYIEQPIVSVIVTEFNGALPQQIRIVGAGTRPAGIPYRANMTLLDAMVAVGGLGEFAAGNSSTLSRLDPRTGKNAKYRLRIKDLMNKGDMTANVALQPGDTISIPESRF